MLADELGPRTRPGAARPAVGGAAPGPAHRLAAGQHAFPAAAPVGATSTARIQSFVPTLPPWPLVGRADQLADLVGALEQAESGSVALAALVGEPGIGKSRLAGELAKVAGERGATVLLGRCSQDDGAPPLWPWQQVLRSLGRDLPEESEGDEDGGGRFRTWEAIAGAVAEAASERTIVVLLDDLHWADVASLRVLRLLGETVQQGHLLVLGTWRSHPEPTDALLDAVETFARRHAVRLDLTGLSADDASRVVEAVSESTPSAPEAAALRERTDGNPFFLVEYARLAREGGDLSGLVAEAHPPAAVNDVLARRLQRLPEESVSTLRWAALVGAPVRPRHAGRGVARRRGRPARPPRPGPGRGAGPRRRHRPVPLRSRPRAGHHLRGDPQHPASPRARPGRGGAGGDRRPRARGGAALARRRPRLRRTAWLACVRAATVARRLHAYEESADLLRAALDALPGDPDATLGERYDLLMDLADAQRWSGDWEGLVGTAEQAIGVADEMGDDVRLGRAATTTSVGALWQSGPHGTVNEVVVSALRRVLEGLPTADGALRCRAMLALALEIYYGSTFEERRALVEEGLAMARRIGDDALLLDACQLAYVALWRRSTAEQRRDLVSEGMELAHRLGDERAYVVTTTLRAVVAGELGLVEEMWEHAVVARDWARRLRLPYGLIVLDSLELPWLAMAGRFDECEQRMADIVRLDQEMALGQTEDATAGALMSLRLWQGRSVEVAPILEQFAEQSVLPVTSTMLVFWLRAGEVDKAREYAASTRSAWTTTTGSR